MLFERFIARRYLISKHRLNFISIISILSTLGITIGVAALIVVLSVFNGFGSLVKSFLMNFDPHLRIELISADYKDEDLSKMIDALTSDNKVLSFAPYVSGKVLALRRELTEIINLKGVDNVKANEIYGIQSSIVLGSDELENKGDLPAIIIGIQLADRLQALVGDTLTIISPAGIERAITQFSLPNSQNFIISGIFSSQNNEYDASLAFISLDYAQNLLGYRNSFQGYEVKLSDINYSFLLKELFQSTFDDKIFSVSTWYDFHKDLYSVMQVERWVAYILLSLIVAVATFNILGSLSMTVIEKKRDIGVLRAMGVKEISIKKIFMYEGLMIGITGTLLGILIGYFILYLQINYNIYPLDPTQYKIDSLPVELRLSDFFFVSGASMLLSFLASYFPASRASRVNTIEAIKWE
jgi:lipoprotein-releasing system permease protein